MTTLNLDKVSLNDMQGIAVERPANIPGPGLPPDLDKAFADLVAPGGRETRSRTDPLQRDIRHQYPPQRKKK